MSGCMRFQWKEFVWEFNENLKIKIVFQVFKIKIIDNQCELNVDLNYDRILYTRNLSKQTLKKERNRLFRNIKVIKTI